MRIQIAPVDFDTPLYEVMGDQTLVSIWFDDAPAGDCYTARLQRVAVGGDASGYIDCLPQLNGKNAWQVHRMQPASRSVGALLLLIASADGGADPHTFFEVPR